MSGLENAIRNALSRSDRGNAEARARIYQSARNALEAGLRKQGVTDAETISSQRRRLEATIQQIDAEERAALQAVVVPVERNEPHAGRADPGGDLSMATEPGDRLRADAPGMRRDRPEQADDIGSVRPERQDGFSPKADRPDASASVGEMSDFRPERAAKAPKRRGRLLPVLLVAAILIAAIGAAVWWVDSNGLLRPSAQRNDGVATSPDGDATGDDPLRRALDTQNRFSADWREVFKPDDIAPLSAGSAGRFESVSTNEGPAVQVTSSVPERDGAVMIEVTPEVLREMSGRTSTVALTLQSANGTPVQVSVECEFSSLGECGRHRFTVSDRTDVLFQVRFDRSLSPNAPGHIFVNSDVGGGGASINLYAARILPGE